MVKASFLQIPLRCLGSYKDLTFAAVVFQAVIISAALFIPHFNKGGRGGDLPKRLYDSDVFESNPPQFPFVKGGGKEYGRL